MSSIQFTQTPASEVPLPSAPDRAVLFLDDADGLLKLKAQTGTVLPVSTALPFSSNLNSVPFLAAASEISRVDPTATLTALLPTLPSDNDEVAFYAVGSTGGGTLTIGGNGKSVFLTGTPSIQVFMPKDTPTFVFLKYSAPDLVWRIVSDRLPLQLAAAANQILISSNTDQQPISVAIADNSVVGRVGGGNIGSVSLSSFGQTVFTSTLYAAPFTAEMGQINRWSGVLSFTATVPDTGLSNGDVVGFFTPNGATGSSLTVNFGTKTLLGIGSSYTIRAQTISATTYPEIVLFKYDTGSAAWVVLNGLQQLLASSSAQSFLRSDANNQVGVVTVPDGNFVGRPVGGSLGAVTPVQAESMLTGLVAKSTYDANTVLKADVDNTPVALAVGTNTVVARAAGSISALSVSAQSLLLRGAGDIANTTIADSTFVGRPAGGNLGSMSPAQAEALLTGLVAKSTYDANTILKADADNTPVALTVGTNTFVARAAGSIVAQSVSAQSLLLRGAGDITDTTIADSTFVGRPAGGNLGPMSPAQAEALLTGLVSKTTYDANTILKADSDNTPVALTVVAQSLVGRLTGGTITALTAAESRRVTNEWVTSVTGAGPFTLLSGRLNRFNDSAAAGMTIRFPAGATDGDEVEIKEVGASTNVVTLTTAAGTTNIETVAGSIATSDTLVLAYAWRRYKWDGTSSIWRIAASLPGTGGGGIPASLFNANTILKADVDDTPVALTVGTNTFVGRAAASITALSVSAQSLLLRAAGDIADTTIAAGNFVGRPTAGNLGQMTPAQAEALLTGLVPKSTYDANTILKADADDTPVALTVATNTIVGRAAASITAFSVSAQSLLLRGAADITNTTIADSMFVGRPAGGNLGQMTPAQAEALLTGLVAKATYDANTILKADSDDTPVALTVATNTLVGRAAASITAFSVSAQSLLLRGAGDITNTTIADSTFVGRPAGGNLGAMTPAQAEALLTGLVAKVTFDANTILKADSDNTPVALTVGTNTFVARAAGSIVAQAISAQSLLLRGSGDIADTTIADSTFVGRPAGGNLGAMTPAQAEALLTGLVAKVTFDANTILKADSDNTPVALTVGAQTLVGRLTGGTIAAITAAEARRITNEWVASVTGAGPFTLLAGRLNRFDDSAAAGMTLRLPAGASDGDEVEIKEVGGSSNAVTLTTAAGTTNIETVAGGVATSDSMTLSRAWRRYKWDGTASVWRIAATYPGAGSNTAEALGTTGADVSVGGAAPPTTGQVLTATNATTATWQTPSGGGGGVTLATAVATSTTTVASSKIQDYDATGGTFTLNAPAAPSRGAMFGIKEAAGLTTAVTVSGNGSNIENPLTGLAGSASFSLGAAFVSLLWVYDGTRWLII